MRKFLAWGLFEKDGGFLAAVTSRAVARKRKKERGHTAIRRVVITIK